MTTTDEKALLAIDESTAGDYVTAGGVYVPRRSLDNVVGALARAKRDFSIDAKEEVHCRILFAGDKRKKTSFKVLKPDQVVAFVSHCVTLATQAGCRWHGVHCDKRTYPTKMIVRSPGDGGNFFPVTSKHIAGLLIGVCATMVDQVEGENYSLVFDKDSTKLDWGLVQRMQATHFGRTSDKAIQIGPEHKPLLELADVAAYVLGRVVQAKEEPGNRRLQRFGFAYSAMNMHAATFGWHSENRNAPYF